MSRHLSLLLILSAYFVSSSAISILVLISALSHSHHIWVQPMVRELLLRGHAVHLVSSFPAKFEEKLQQNITFTILENLATGVLNEWNLRSWHDQSTFFSTYLMSSVSAEFCDTYLQTNAAKDVLQLVKKIQFDVILSDVTTGECNVALWEVAKGKPPVVAFITMGNAAYFNEYTGGPNYPMIRPYYQYSIGVLDGIWKRTLNVIYYTLENFIRQYHAKINIQAHSDNFVGEKLRPLVNIERDVNILLINSYHAFESAMPLLPNTIEVGGLHAQIATPISDQKIKKFLDDAKHGVLLISLGSNLKWEEFGMESLQLIINVLSKLKERVLWKVDESLIKLEFPKNVMATKWLQQSSVITHKNVKAIWTHAGLLSMQEAIWNAVPVIGMPIFLDQWGNIDMLVNKGAAIRLELDMLTEDHLLNVLNEMFNNPSYKRNMKQLSLQFRERPVPPLDLAVWWVEYIARHPEWKIASPAKYMSWFEWNMIDAYAVLFTILALIIFLFYIALKQVIKNVRFIKLILYRCEKKKKL